MKQIPNNFYEYDYYKLICAISKCMYKMQIIDNTLLSKISISYDLNNIYNNVKYNLNENKEIESINLNDALFSAASFGFVKLNQTYDKSISIILKSEDECHRVIQLAGPERYKAVMPIVSNLIAVQNALIENEEEQKKL